MESAKLSCFWRLLRYWASLWENTWDGDSLVSVDLSVALEVLWSAMEAAFTRLNRRISVGDSFSIVEFVGSENTGRDSASLLMDGFVRTIIAAGFAHADIEGLCFTKFLALLLPSTLVVLLVAPLTEGCLVRLSGCWELLKGANLEN